MNTSVAIVSQHRRRFRRLVWVALGLVVMWLASAFAVTWKLTGRAAPMATEAQAPNSLGQVESLRLSTSDGETLGAWFVRGSPMKPAIVLMHGNRGSRHAVVNVAQWLRKLDFPILMPTLRAHGDSTGEKNDLGYSACHDAIAAVAELERRCAGQPVVLFGQSLGAAAALFAAEPLGDRVAGLILECPYENLYTAARNRTRAYLPAPLDFVAYAGLRVAAPIVLPDVDRINLVDAAGRVPAKMPVLVLAGGKDDRARPEEARRIVDRLGSRARLEVMADAKHLNLCECDRSNYLRCVVDFLLQIEEPELKR